MIVISSRYIRLSVSVVICSVLVVLCWCSDVSV